MSQDERGRARFLVRPSLPSPKTDADICRHHSQHFLEEADRPLCGQVGSSLARYFSLEVCRSHSPVWPAFAPGHFRSHLSPPPIMGEETSHEDDDHDPEKNRQHDRNAFVTRLVWRDGLSFVQSAR